MVAQLLSDQLQALVSYGTGQDTLTPLPFKVETMARRILRHKSIEQGIYRDRYERLPLSPRARVRDVQMAEDWDAIRAQEALAKRESGEDRANQESLSTDAGKDALSKDAETDGKQDSTEETPTDENSPWKCVIL
jgi:hypothetical protein